MTREEKLTYIKLLGFGVILSLLLLVRIVSFNSNVLNPDELEWLYGIDRIFVDPRPFVGFEAHTSGPMSIYILSLIKIFVANPTTMHLRIFCFILFILPTFILLFRFKKKVYNFAGVCFLFLLLSIKHEDFYCYNSEYQIMVFTAILYTILISELTIWRVLTYALFLVLFFFIKIQVALILLFFGIAMLIRLLYRRSYFFAAIYLIVGISLLAAVVLYLWYTSTLNEAYFVYIEKNMFYNSTISVKSYEWRSIFKTFLKTQYHFFLYPILIVTGCFVLLFLFVRKTFRISNDFIKDLIESDLFLSLLLYIVSIVTILVSKNNFIHYFIISFLPLSLLFSELYLLINQKKITLKYRFDYRFFLLVFFLAQLNITSLTNGFKYIFSNSHERELYYLGLSNGFEVNPQSVNWLKRRLIGKSTPILTLGWFKSQMYYYKLKPFCNPVYRSANFFWYLSTFEFKIDDIFKREEANLMEDLEKKPPFYIVDCEGILEKTKGAKFSNYVQANYVLVNSGYNYKIYQRQSNGISKYNRLL